RTRSDESKALYLLQILRLRQIVEAGQAEDFQKARRRGVKDLGRGLFARQDVNESTTNELPQQATGLGPAQAVDFDLADRLAVRDQREHIDGGWREPGFTHAAVQLFHDRLILGAQYQDV